MRGETYEEFVAKFQPKKTTDDCYTPPEVYEAVRNWACNKYGIDPERIVRPFWSGGDYEHFNYPDGCVVLDNPPFSILSQICAFYLDRGIDFFLFAPTLTNFSGRDVSMRMNHIVCDAKVIYENGAVVNTSFLTSFGGDIVAQTAPDLYEAIEFAVKELKRRSAATVPKYQYPDQILTAAMLQRYSKYGINFEIRRGESVHISKMDAQMEQKKTIYGSGLLLSASAAKRKAAAERAAIEKAAIEKAKATVWELSDREKQIIESLD